MHGWRGSQSALELQAPPNGMGFVDEAGSQSPPVQLAAAQHEGRPGPQIPWGGVQKHCPMVSPWPRCPRTAFTLTVISCTFDWLPGGRWQMVMVKGVV